MKIQVFHFNPFMENTYVLYDDTSQCALVDPGMSNAAEQKVIQNFIASNQLTVAQILLTHAHIDHLFGLAWAQDTYGLPARCHPEEDLVLKSVPVIGEHYGFDGMSEPQNIAFFEAGTSVSFGETTLNIRFTPGHSPGSVCFLEHEGHDIIAGDVLFKESIGRTDLPGGDHGTLLDSIRTQLLVLEDDWKVYPGHGPMTTIGYERHHNPFLTEY